MPRKHKVFVADDDAAICEAMTLILEDEGYQVVTAPEDQIEAAVEAELPDILLLDIWMAGVDGGQVCLNLKQKRTTRQIPIILVSANRDTSKIAAECQADDFIAKPFETNELLSKVAKHLAA